MLSDRSCVHCNTEKRARLYAADPEKFRAVRRAQYAANPEPEKIVARVRSAEWRKANPGHKGNRLAKNKWKENNAGKVRADTVKRRTAKINRTPAWLDIVQNAEIEFTYIYCAALRSVGMDYHVDHVVPLQGNIASGLHTPWNLQVIHARENESKGNRI